MIQDRYNNLPDTVSLVVLLFPLPPFLHVTPRLASYPGSLIIAGEEKRAWFQSLTHAPNCPGIPGRQYSRLNFRSNFRTVVLMRKRSFPGSVPKYACAMFDTAILAAMVLCAHAPHIQSTEIRTEVQSTVCTTVIFRLMYDVSSRFI